MKTQTRNKVSDVLAGFGVWWGCFIIPAVVVFMTENKYYGVATIAIVALLALWLSKKVKK